jgi:flagellar basal-body rod protein FlgG
MSQTGKIIGSALSSQQFNLDVIANNIANVNTVGYKSTRVEFESTLLMFTQGQLQDTGRPLDVALNGPGFLQVQLPNGATGYTRDGELGVDANGQLVTHGGLRLIPNMTVPAGAEVLGIDESGNVQIQETDKTMPTVLGQLTLAKFPNPEGLKTIGDNLYAASMNSGAATVAAPGTAGSAALRSGALEESNVDIGEELTRMMQAQRAYQLGASTFKAWDQAMAQSVRLRS